MSAAVLSNSLFECSNDILFRNNLVQKKEPPPTMGQNGALVNSTNGHAPLRRASCAMLSIFEQQHRKLDRSVSEPASRYKTELCRPFEESGVCKYADKCQFAHGYGELRNLQRHPKYKTVMCRTYHSIGFCPYGPRCHFVHNIEEARAHNQKVAAQSNMMSINPLLINSAANAAVVNTNNLHLLQIMHQLSQNDMLQKSLGESSYLEGLKQFNSRQMITRTNSLGISNNSSTQAVTARPKPLTLSPTFSLGSTADSISPSSSLSQSPTNSMASFFSEEPAAAPAFAFGQDFNLLDTTRQSHSPPILAGVEELAPRSPSPMSPGSDSRLPVFNRISNPMSEFENLKI